MTVRNLNSDKFALFEFKDRIVDPQNVLANNWTNSTSVCKWVGVSCGIIHERVVALNLTNMNLRRTIPPHLGNLSFLFSLDLSNNNFYGHLPKELGQLHRLRIIQLSYNRLNGEIPPWLGNLHRVQRLEMRNNNFTGTIPQTLVNLSNLEILNLGFNQLSGQVPSSIFNISSLKRIHFRDNSLSGGLPMICVRNELSSSIPSSIDKCCNLQILELSINQFSGIIPKSIGNLTQLKQLYLGQIPEEIGNLFSLEMLSIQAIKGLTGQIPTSIFNIYSLKTIALSSNSLSGSLPNDMCNLPPITNAPKLEILLLWGNKLSGNIPNSVSNASMLKILSFLKHLEVLKIFDNNLITGSASDHEWSFLSSLTNCRNLKAIGVSGNLLSGVLPTYIGNLSKSLQFFLAYNCELQGIIPMEIGNLTNLLLLELDYNKLSGLIPASIGGMRNLQGLTFYNNKLGGPIPESLCGLERLYQMYLGLNKLHGSIPSCLGNISALRYLWLDSNKLSSTIPSTLWSLKDILEIDLSSNHLHNSHAIDVGNFRTLLRLNLSRNLLMGDILSTFGVFKLCLEFLDLCNNNLSGVIHKSLEKLLYLKYFNVSFNRLEGEIPSKGSTNGFEESNMRISGSFGYVYKGRLSDGMEVAIKVFNLQTEGAFRSFGIECDAMRNIVHRNIVKVITCCSSVDFKALVLDYMSNGNLEKWLHSENCFLDIIQRVEIMIDVAVAIEHLHNGHPTPIIHCDIKPSNILLDEDMVAHVGDFGVAKLLGEGEVMKQTMTLATMGYMAPETFTKKKPTDNAFVEEETIRHWMERSLPKGAIEIADVDLLRREDEYIVVKANCISSIMELALNCSAELPEERKDMKDVVVELKKIKQRLLNNIQHF
ncbi:hypothetical protein ES288_D05G401900v1 [Gossypium darwinii]|uniref:Protein kinase domain-containing protein n=1 Tax=Gossypium darwinii TaxID=34276 RepID=A0A5D2CTD9_GOSDA|nr:hypothetical protein ES288_D05G401900v1 [Gossypium darwinii]